MRPRWLIIGLVASVALNLFLISAAAGVMALGSRLARENAARPGALFWATQSLPQPDRRNMREMLRQVRDEVRPQTEQSRALRLSAWGALTADKPDAATIKQDLAQSRQIDIQVRGKVEEKIADYVAGLPPAERASFAAGMRRALTPPPPRPR
jgi:uncharacterized membrane protein